MLATVRISPSHLAEARDRANLTQNELAAMLDVGLRTIQNWESDRSEGVPRKMVDRVRRYIGDALDEVEAAEQIAIDLKKVPMQSIVDDSGSTLSRFSDVALLRELLRRAVRRRHNDEDHPDMGQGRGVIDFPPINVGELSDDEVASIHELAEKGQIPAAAGSDSSTPREDGAPED
jgi:transcriptional regulator with XRE-family HTH domain